MKTIPLAVLALIALSFPANPVRAGDAKRSAPATELALIPDDALAFLTIRPAALLDTLALNGRSDKLACLQEFKRSIGLSLDEVEQCTFLFPTMQADGCCAIVRTRTPYKPNEILKESFSGAKKCKINGKTCHIKSNQAACLFDKQILILAMSEESLTACLKGASKVRRDEGLANALKLAAPCDVAFWARASLIPDAESVLPRGLESGLLTLDIGAQLALNVRITCTDQDAKAWAAKALRMSVDLARAALLVVPVTIDACELVPGVVEKDLIRTMRMFPVTLMRQAEKGLQEARITTADNHVGLSVSMPIDAKALRAEVAGMVRMMNKAPDGEDLLSRLGIQKQMAGMTLPSGRYLEHRPQYFPEEPDFPLQKELAYQEEISGLSAPGSRAVPASSEVIRMRAGNAAIGLASVPLPASTDSNPASSLLDALPPCNSSVSEPLTLFEIIESTKSKDHQNIVSFRSMGVTSTYRDGVLVERVVEDEFLPQVTGAKSDSTPTSTGVGKLRRTSFTIDGKQAYALDSLNGQVAYYLTAGKNVSLDAYLNRWVVLKGDA